MARNPRRDLTGHYFHIMVQGIGKEYVFPTDEFNGYYLTCLQKAREKADINILGFCVLGNHGHLSLLFIQPELYDRSRAEEETFSASYNDEKKLWFLLVLLNVYEMEYKKYTIDAVSGKIVEEEIFKLG